MRILHAIGLVLTTAGCATVTRGTTDQVSVTSVPSGAHVATSLHQDCTTPCTLEVSRKAEFAVHVEAPGYAPQNVDVKTTVAGAGAAGFAGNVLVGGVVGMGVDAATGSTLEHVPNPVHVELQPAGAAARKGAKRRRGLVAPTEQAPLAPQS